VKAITVLAFYIIIAALVEVLCGLKFHVATTEAVVVLCAEIYPS